MSRADNAWAQAQATAHRDGAQGAASLYLQAAHAYVAEGRAPIALSVLVEVLFPKEKKRGLFRRKETDSLGPERARLATTFAEIARQVPASESTLEMLGQLAIDMPDAPVVRLANAEKLRESGYLVDAAEEFRYYSHLAPDDGAALASLSQLYATLERPEQGLEYLRSAVDAFARTGDVDAAARSVLSYLDIEPAAVAEIPNVLFFLDVDQEAHAAALTGLALWLRARKMPSAREREAVTKMLGAVDQRIRELGGAKATPAWSLQNEVAVSRPTTHARTEATSVRPEQHVTSEAPAPAQEERQSPPSDRDHAVKAAVKASESRKPPAAAAALTSFTRRKARQLFDAGDIAGAAECYERLAKMDGNVEDMRALVRCYAALNRTPDAVAHGIRIADQQAGAGDLQAAFDTLTWLLTVAPDADVMSRRAELSAALDHEKTDPQRNEIAGPGRSF